ncbi:MAG TPA: hypothetical protein VF169_08135 [Albitalea sp.]
MKRIGMQDVSAPALALSSAVHNGIEPARCSMCCARSTWTDFTRHFGPRSGDDPKIRNAKQRYRLTIFALGTGWP